MSAYYPRIRVYNLDNYLFLREGLSICFYLRHSQQHVAHAIESALDSYLAVVGAEALSSYIDFEGEYRPLDANVWKRIRHDLRNDPWTIIHLTDDTEDKKGFEFEFYGKDFDDARMSEPGTNCALRFSLSTEFLEQVGPSKLRDLALRWAEPLPFSYGHAGLSFNGATDTVGVYETVHKQRLRYPGIDHIDSMNGLSWELGTRVRGPAWLTFLGQPVLGELGGVEALRSRLRSPETTVEPLSGDRAIVTLGEWPEAGDFEQGQTLPAYRELARVLEPWTYFDDRSFKKEDEAYQRWERRFLDPT